MILLHMRETPFFSLSARCGAALACSASILRVGSAFCTSFALKATWR
jgi:hypothetical protein